jgi:Ca2+-binding RTX toxin-like protein
MAMNYSNPTPFWRDDVTGSAGRDSIFTFWDNDIIRGFEGNDTLNGGQGNDTIYGGDDNDKIFGEVGDDYLSGQDGNDTIDGGLFNDQIYGGDGNDRIIGGSGDDRMFGGDDDDTFIQDATYNNDLIDGGSGVDTVDYGATRQIQAVITLTDSGNGSAVLRPHEYLGHLFGETEDLGLGDAWSEILRGVENIITGAENDDVTGNASANRISTNAGRDVLTGRGGEDILNGGSGSDTFVFINRSDSSVAINGSFSSSDRIIGFGDSAGNQDVIDLRRIDADLTATATGDQAFRLDDRDGRIEVGELQFRQIIDDEQGGQQVTVMAADTDGDGRFDFGMRFDRVVATLEASDFIL